MNFRVPPLLTSDTITQTAVFANPAKARGRYGRFVFAA